MKLVSNRLAITHVAAILSACLGIVAAIGFASADEPSRTGKSDFPTVPPERKHTRLLLENAMRYAASGNGLVDPVSGYPFEGWNHDPKNGVFLRSFTQLTAIGLYMELLANVVAGEADSPGLSREQALAALTKLVATLRRDQKDPRLGTKGLMANFLDLASGKRLGPLASDVDKRRLLEVFGPKKGEAIWKALQAKGWLVSRNKDTEAAIKRDAKFGAEHFDGPLDPFKDKATKTKIMDVLDERVVMVVFGDNSNLTTSVAKTLGALLTPAITERPEIAKVRRDLEQFLDDQREGYAHLFDAKVGLLYFGWDAHKDRLFGWEDPDGKWITGHMDYFVNEFRAPATFVAARFGLPTDAIANLGFKIKPYTTREGKVIPALAPWEGSAFQAMGLELSLSELGRPVWRELLENVVDIEVDYSGRKDLPGFLSESYTGDGVQYTGSVGIPEITVSPKPRQTDAASLYTLGVASTIAPGKVERFLAANWPAISGLLTDHGPWEGFNVAKREPIRFQTSAHTFSLILGVLGTGSRHMDRYVDHYGFTAKLDAFFPVGDKADLLSGENQAYAWANKDGRIQSRKEEGAFHVKGESVTMLGIALVPNRNEGVSLSGGHLTIRYRSVGAIGPVTIALKPPGGPAASAGWIPKEIFTRLADTGGREEKIRVPLPASVGLSRVKEVVLTHESGSDGRTIDLTITRVSFVPGADQVDSPR